LLSSDFFNPLLSDSNLISPCGWIPSQSFFPAMTKIVGTLGPKSRSVDTISSCLKAGMSGNFSLSVSPCLALSASLASSDYTTISFLFFSFLF
jgi:hypothetical protein